MAIYKDDKKVVNVLHGERSVGTVTHGHDIVFSKKVPNEGFIEIEVDSSDGTYIIPLGSYHGSGSSYALTVYVNGVYYGNYTGTSNHSTGTGIKITGLTGSTTIIRIEPTGVVSLGWGKTFGYYENTLGCNGLGNKFKLLRIVNDPDYAHLDSLTSVGNFFRGYQYSRCTSLKSVPVAEYLPDSITLIGDNFRRGQYYYCTSLTNVPAEYLPDSVISIGNYFRYYQYYSCTSLTIAAAEVLPDSVKSIGDNFRGVQYNGCASLISSPTEVLSDTIISIGNSFRASQYSKCTSLISASAEVLPNRILSIGDRFRSYQYNECKSLSIAPAEMLPENVLSIGDAFRVNQYSGCTSLTIVPAEVLPDSVMSIGNYFRGYQYSGCTLITSTAAEVLTEGITQVVDYFRYYQYFNCTSLLINGHIHTYQFTTLLNAGVNNYVRMFYAIEIKTDADTVPMYYTDSSQTTTAPIKELTPTTEKNYLTNRIGVSGYEDIDSNWK